MTPEPTPPSEATAAEQALMQEILAELDREYAARIGVAPRPGLLAAVTQDAVTQMLVRDRAIRTVQQEAIRRISEAMGHPLKGRMSTPLDIADLAVAKVKACNAALELATLARARLKQQDADEEVAAR